MRVLVTGALGYVGAAVTEHLADHGWQVVALSSRPGARFPRPDVRTVHADLRDPAAVTAAVEAADVEAVCHLAARNRVRESLADPLPHYAVNLAGTVTLLQALDRAAGPRVPAVVLASTAAVYGTAQGSLTEATPPAPASPYGRSKLAAEGVLADHAAAGRVAAVSLRCFNIAGTVAGRPDPEPSRIVPRCLAAAAGLVDRVEVNGDGSARRDFTHLADVARAFRLALEAARPGRHRVFNLGTGQGISVAEILAGVRELTGRPVPAVHLPPRPEPAVLVGDSSRLREELGWRPERSTLPELLADGWAALTATSR